MKLPSKIISYRESVLSKFAPILDIIQSGDIGIFSLYETTERYFYNIEEFIDTLDCLFALHKISYDAEQGVLHYAT